MSNFSSANREFCLSALCRTWTFKTVVKQPEQKQPECQSKCTNLLRLILINCGGNKRLHNRAKGGLLWCHCKSHLIKVSSGWMAHRLDIHFHRTGNTVCAVKCPPSLVEKHVIISLRERKTGCKHTHTCRHKHTHTQTHTPPLASTQLQMAQSYKMTLQNKDRPGNWWQRPNTHTRLLPKITHKAAFVSIITTAGIAEAEIHTVTF